MGQQLDNFFSLLATWLVTIQRLRYVWVLRALREASEKWKVESNTARRACACMTRQKKGDSTLGRRDRQEEVQGEMWRERNRVPVRLHSRVCAFFVSTGPGQAKPSQTGSWGPAHLSSAPSSQPASQPASLPTYPTTIYLSKPSHRNMCKFVPQPDSSIRFNPSSTSSHDLLARSHDRHFRPCARACSAIAHGPRRQGAAGKAALQPTRALAPRGTEHPALE